VRVIKRLATFLKTAIMRDGALVIGAQGMSALVALFVGAYLFRTLPKFEQGALASGLALGAGLLQASDLGLALTTIRVGANYIAENHPDKAAKLFRSMLAARVVFAFLTLLLTTFFADRIALTILSMPGGRMIVIGAAMGVLGNAVVWWGVDVAQARRAFGSYSIQQLLSAFSKALVVAMLIVLGGKMFTENTAVSILVGIAVANVVCGLTSLLLTRDVLVSRKLEVETLDVHIANTSIRYFEFGAYACAVSVLTALSANADVLLVQHYLKEEDTAVLACARRLAMVLNLIATAGVTILLPRAAALESRDACKAYALKAAKMGFILAVVMAGGLAVAASTLVPIFGGANYTASIPILRWLCLAHGIGMVLTPLMLVFYPLRREGVIVFLCALQLVAQVGLGMLWAPGYRLEGAAWAMVVAKFCVAVATLFFLSKAFKCVDSVSKSAPIR